MPRRRCVGCGRVAPKAELVRLAAVRVDESGPTRLLARRPRRAVLDTTGTLPGRGAYLCRAGALPSAACLALAERRRGLSRALRCMVTLDPEIVESTRVAQPAEGRLAETGTDQGDTRYARIPESASAAGACHPASVGPIDLSLNP